MTILEILNPECIALDVHINSKQEIIEFIVNLASKSGKVLDFDLAKADVEEREKVLSTGVGKGIAIPYAKTKAVETFVLAVATLAEPLEYDSLDSEPVRIVILLLGPEGNIGMNLKILSKISKLLNNEDFRTSLLTTHSTSGILDLFEKFENYS